MAVSSVCCLFSLLSFLVVVPPGSLLDANIKAFCLLAAESGGVFCLCFSPFIWDSNCLILCSATEKLFWQNEQNGAWGSFSALLIQAWNLSSVNHTFWNLHLYFPEDMLISSTISDLPLNEKKVCLIHKWCKSNNNKLFTTQRPVLKRKQVIYFQTESKYVRQKLQVSYSKHFTNILLLNGKKNQSSYFKSQDNTS